MATAASLKFSIESKWDGSGVRKAKEDLADLQKQLRDIGNKVTARVKVEPSMVGFASKVRNEARGITVDVRIDPNLTGFQGRLTAAARDRGFRVQARVDPTISASAVSDLQDRLDDRDFSVRVRLEPRAAGFQARLNALSAAHDWHVTVDVQVNSSSLSSLNSRLNQLSSSSSGAGSSVASLTSRLLALVPAFSAVTAAAAAMAFEALTPLIATALQATTVLAALPAAIAGVGLVVGTVKIGLDGMSEAFAGLAIEGGNFAMSADEFQAVLDKELMPAAHDFMWALRDLRWEWEELTATVQTNLFQGLGQQMREIGDIYMPKLKTGFAGISEELNKGLIRFFDKLKDPQYGAAVDTLFSNITKAVGPATDAIGDFALGLLNIASAGSGALPQIADDLARIAENFRKWTENPENAEKVKRWILEGWESLKDIGSFVAEFVTQTLPKLGAWIDQHKDDFKTWKEDIDGFLSGLETAQDVLGTIGSLIAVIANPAAIFDDNANGWGDSLVSNLQDLLGITGSVEGALNGLKSAFMDVGIFAAQMGANVLRAMADVVGAIPGMDGVAAKMDAAARAIELGVIPALQKTKNELLGIPADKKVTVTANTSAALFSMQDVYTLMNQLDAAQVTPEVRAQVQQALVDFKLTQDELNTIAGMNPSPEVTAIIDAAIKNLATVKGDLDTTGAKVATPTVNLNDNASGPLGAISSQLDGLNGRIVTSTVVVQTQTYSANVGSWRGGVAGRWKGGISPKVPGFAGGGHTGYRLPTSGPGTHMRDGFLGLTRGGKPLVNVDAGEWIINGRSSQKFHRALSALNKNDPMSAITALQQHIRPGGGTRPRVSTGAAPKASLEAQERVVVLRLEGNASAETFRAAKAELVPALVMQMKQGVGVRAKVKG